MTVDSAWNEAELQARLSIPLAGVQLEGLSQHRVLDLLFGLPRVAQGTLAVNLEGDLDDKLPKASFTAVTVSPAVMRRSCT